MAGLTAHVVDLLPPHTQGTPPQSPLITVLLHGFGAPGDDLVGLAPMVAAPTRFVFPEAPLRLGGLYGDARAWWPLDLAALEARLRAGAARTIATDEVPDGLPEARAQVAKLVEEVAARFAVAPERIVLGGFSQGAMLALDVALHATAALAGVVVMSGTFVAGSEWIPRLPNLANKPVFQSHGRQDPLLPFSLAELLADRLRQAGVRVDWHPFDGGHTIPPRVLGELAAFLRTLS